MLRIATWNVERPKHSEATRRDRLLKTIQAVQADIWILTEIHTLSHLALASPLSPLSEQIALMNPVRTG